MHSGNKIPENREYLLELDIRAYSRIANEIKNRAEAAQYTGEIGPDTDNSETVDIRGGVIYEGYENLPVLFHKIGNGLKKHPYFDLSLEGTSIGGDEQDCELLLRLYGNDSNDFHVTRISSDEFVPYWTHADGPAPEAESPDGDHTKLTEKDMKALLWGLVCTGDDGDFAMLDDSLSLQQVALMAASKAELDAKDFSWASTFSTPDFDEFESDPASIIPGSNLTVIKSRKKELKEFESTTSESTTFYLLIRHAESVPSPHNAQSSGSNEAQTIPVWVDYSFTAVYDESDKLVYAAAGADLAYQEPDSAHVISLPEFWLRVQRANDQQEIVLDFEKFIKDGLDDLFPDRLH